MSDFVVIKSADTFAFIKELYICEVLNFMEDPRSALLNREYMAKLIEVGKDLYSDFWSIIKEEFGEASAVEIKQIYETYK
jgi:hypothetical protein